MKLLSDTFIMPILFIIMTIVGKCIESRLKFDEKIIDLIAIKGQTVYLDCHVEHLGGHKIGWIKFDNKIIQAVDTHVINQNNRTKVAHWQRRIWTLQIFDVQLEDSGQYLCQINTMPIKNQVFNLKVVISPRFQNENMSTELKFVLNENDNDVIHLNCQVFGHPLPKIEWFKNHGKIDFNQSRFQLTRKKTFYVIDETMSIRSANRHDTGHYSCYASNGIFASVSKKFAVYVHFKPKIYLDGDKIYGSVGDNVTLHCNIVSSPETFHFWTFNSREIIINSKKYYFTERKTAEFKTDIFLKIHEIDNNDFGFYDCNAKNTAGSDKRSIFLSEGISIESTTSSVSPKSEIENQKESNANQNKPLRNCFYLYYEIFYLLLLNNVF